MRWRRVAVAGAALLVASCLLALQHIYHDRDSPQFEALKTITLVLNSKGQVVSQAAGGAAPQNSGRAQTIHLDLDGHGNVLNQGGAVDDGAAEDDGHTVSIALDNNGQMVSRQAEAMTAPATPQQLAEQQEEAEQEAQQGPPNYNSYQKLTWPEPPRGFGLRGGQRQRAQAGKPITIMLNTGNHGNAGQVVQRTSLEQAHGAQSGIQQEIERDTQRMYRRLAARDRRREQKLAQSVKEETDSAVTQMKKVLTSELAPLKTLMAPKQTQLATGKQALKPFGKRHFPAAITTTMKANRPLTQLAATSAKQKPTVASLVAGPDVADALTQSVKKEDDPELMEYLQKTLNPIKEKLYDLKDKLKGK
jgi:hypothetical protein